MRVLIMLIFCGGFSIPLSFGQITNCYQSLVEEGHKLYEQQFFEKAIARFKAANVCPDKPKGSKVLSLIDTVNKGYRIFLQKERDIALLAEADASTARDNALKANKALAEQLLIAEANNLSFLASLAMERAQPQEALQLAFLAYQKVPNLPSVLQTFGEVSFFAESKELVHQQDAIYLAAFTTTPPKFITVAYHQPISVWDKTGQLKHSLQGHKSLLSVLTLSPSGKLLLSGDNSGQVNLWSTSGALIQSIQTHKSAISHLQFSPTDTFFASTELENDTIYLWHANGSLRKKLIGHTNYITDLRIGSNQQIISTAADGTLKIWDKTGQLLKDLKISESPLWASILSENGQEILSYGAQSAAQLWTQEGQKKKDFVSDAFIKNVGFISNTPYVHLSNAAGTFRILNKDGTLLKEANNKPKTFEGDVTFTNNQLFFFANQEDTLHLMNLKGESLKTFVHTAPLRKAQFSPDSRLILTISEEEKVKLWDWEGNTLLNWQPKKGKVRLAQFSPDGEYLLLSADTAETIICRNPLKLLKELEANPLPPLSLEKRKEYGLE